MGPGDLNPFSVIIQKQCFLESTYLTPHMFVKNKMSYYSYEGVLLFTFFRDTFFPYYKGWTNRNNSGLPPSADQSHLFCQFKVD